MPVNSTRSTSSNTPVTPQPAPTSTPQSSNTSSAAGNSSTPTAQETKSSQQLATAKKEEFGLSSISNKLNSALDTVKQFGSKVVKESELQNIAESATKSGLKDSETTELTNRLRGMDDQKFESETKFLKENVMNTPNTDRALRTYNELKGMQDGNAERLQDKHIHLLTKGVAQPRATYQVAMGPVNLRIEYPTGLEGMLGQDGARKAAEALKGMPETDYKTLDGLLENAGKKDGERVSGSNADMEKVLILKAAGAHHQELSNPSAADRAWTLAGEPSTKMSEIAAYAKDIRGEKYEKLAQQSTSIDPYWGNSSLQQRWDHSCGPTTAQGMKAEIDPMYARQLHQDFIHNSTNLTDKIALEQKEVLEKRLGGLDPGIAVPRGTPGGYGSFLNLVLNDQVSKYTQVTYSLNKITPNTRSTREAELDNVADKLKAGVDVPIAAAFPNNVEHFMYLTDVRGSGDDQTFLLADPWHGKNVWMTREELARDRAPFPLGGGTLYAAYY
jgi:hypothetical protein